MGANNLTPSQKRIIALLGLPSFGLALSATAVVTYTPIVARNFTGSTTIVGSIIAIEGLVAVFLPVLAGAWSDHLRTRLGGRLPFLIVGLPVSALALVFLGFANSMAGIIIGLTVFFAAYYLAYEPYRALYPDLIADRNAARAQSGQALWRGVGTGVALTAGGFLFAVSRWLPFVMSAALVLVSSAIFLWALLAQFGVPKHPHRQFTSIKDSYVDAINILRRQRQMRHFIIANALWELTLAALKSFILLYLTVGLGKSKTVAAVLISVTSIVMFLAAPLAGELGDRYGIIRVARLAALVFGLGLLAPGLTSNPWLVLPILPIGAFGGATVLTLPYAMLMPMMPKDQHGQLTGLYSASRGIGIMLGPLLAGAAISLTKNILPADGYSAMWLVCAGAMLLSVYPLTKLHPPKASSKRQSEAGSFEPSPLN
jgi:MFS family permease